MTFFLAQMKWVASSRLLHENLDRSTLVIAKLDRSGRDAHFHLGLKKAGVEFFAVDNPHANKLTVGLLALVAQYEREMIAPRTKAALAAAKARGQRLVGLRPNSSEIGRLGGRPAAKYSNSLGAMRSEMARRPCRCVGPPVEYSMWALRSP